jgi:SPP1 gp7 family putative phage head morphogenesis protein
MPHDEASRFIRLKPSISRQVFDQMLPELQARTFVISGIENLKIMQTVRDAIAKIPEGADWDATKRTVTDLIASIGDKAPQRAETLLRTHVFQAYAAAEHRALTTPENLEVFPFWQYKTMGDDRVRDSHAALDDLILPSNDVFWKTHFPPWEWGCRCQVIPRLRAEVDEIKQRERDLPPEKKTVIDHDQPARLARLRAGTLDRQLPATDPRGPDVGLAQLGQSRTWDVTSDAERGKEGALQWDPGSLNLDIADLKTKYDPDLWLAFETAMRAHQIPELGASAWEWVTRNTPQWTATVNAKTRTSVIARIESGIRGKTSGEVAFVVGADGVNYPVKQAAGTTMILSSQELQQFAGKTGIHNHPASSAYSPEDLRSFVDSGAVEWRVVGPETSYIMRRPPGGWPKDVHDKINGLEKRYFAIAARRERYGHDRIDLDKWAAHRIWSDWANDVGAPFQFIAEMP